MVSVKDIMHGITTIGFNASVRDAAGLMKDKEVGSLMVEIAGDIKGIVTERDILKRVVAEGRDPNETRVMDIMTRQLVSIPSNAGIVEASQLLNKHNIRRLPVEENGKIIGIVTARGIAKAIPMQIVRKGDYVPEG